MNYQIQEFFKHGPVVVVVWKNAEKYPVDYVTENVIELIGYTAQELIAPGFDYESLIHPDDAERISDDVESNVKSNIEYYTHEPYRLRHKSGAYVWVLDFSKVFRNENNEVIYYQGYLVNYTAEHLVKLQLYDQNREIKHQQEKLKLILSAAQAGTWEWNIKTGYLQIDDRWAGMLGYHRSEILPHVDSWVKLVHPNDYLDVENIIKTHINGLSNYYVATYRLKTKSGNWKWILDSGKIIKYDENKQAILFIGTHMDIDAQKRIEQELLNSKMEALKESVRYKNLFNAITDAVFVIPFEQGIKPFLEVNESACKKYGYSFAEFGKLNFDLLTNNTASKTFVRLNMYNELQLKGFFEFEDVHYTRAGNPIDVLVNMRIFEWEQERNLVCVVRDITSEKKYNEQLKQMNIELQLARNKAEESDLLKSAFLSNMSHEIRTPLNAIVGFSGFLKEPGKTQEQLMRYGSIIESSGKHLLGLINDIIDLSKIDSGQVEAIHVDVDVHVLMQNLFQSFQEQIRISGKKIELIMSKAKWELQFMCDETRLNQIFINLLNNALKFTETGSIEFGYMIDQKEIEFFVKDSGIGIAEEKQSIVFDRFRQADESNEKNYAGSGLGLPIVKANVKLLGGRLQLNSGPGKGTTVSFFLPYLQAQNKGQEGLLSSFLQFENELILVAEDDIMNFNFMNELLSDHNLKVLHARNGKETLDMVINNDAIRLVLLDIKMPEIDGWELISILKSQRPDLVVIAQTAYSLENEVKRGVELGFDDYITKPIDYQKLLQTIHAYLY